MGEGRDGSDPGWPRTLSIIGLGRIAEHQLKALAVTGRWDLAGAADVDAARQACLPPGVPFFASAEALLRAIPTDLVMVATPTDTHFELGLQVLDAGASLLLEKPCCASEPEFLSLVEAASSRRSLFHTALHSTFARELDWFLARRGIFPDAAPTEIHCRFSDPYFKDGALREEARSLGDAWTDSGINALAVVAKIVDPLGLAPAGTAFHRAGGLVVAAEASFVAPGTTARIETSWIEGVNSKTTTLKWEGDDIEVLLDHSNECLRIRRGGSGAQIIAMAPTHGRLVNHYIGVFEEASAAMAMGRSNAAMSQAIHALLFAARRAEGRNGP